MSRLSDLYKAKEKNKLDIINKDLNLGWRIEIVK